MFQVVHSIYPLTITNFFVKLPFVDVHRCTRNFNVNFKVFGCYLNVKQNFIVHKGVMLWNKLPTVLKMIIHITTYKQRLKLLVCSLQD